MSLNQNRSLAHSMKGYTTMDKINCMQSFKITLVGTSIHFGGPCRNNCYFCRIYYINTFLKEGQILLKIVDNLTTVFEKSLLQVTLIDINQEQCSSRHVPLNILLQECRIVWRWWWWGWWGCG
jgi:hypothetical protein